MSLGSRGIALLLLAGLPALLAVNSAADQVNPPELGLMEREITKVHQGRYILIPISAATPGHGTHSLPTIWGGYLAELLKLTDRPE